MIIRSELDLADLIRDLGGILWLVGGAIRDELLGKTCSDRDYLITGLAIEDVPFNKIAGKEFPVFIVDIGGIKCKVALARKERKVGEGYKGFTFYTDKSVTVEEDLYRRDITINAIAKNILTGELVDPFNGIHDIANKCIRYTSPAFAEDPLRILRVARFAAKLEDFTISYDTIALMISMREELFTIKPERIWQELEKVLACDKPSKFFDTLYESGALFIIFPEIAELDVPDMHDGTAYRHTMKVLDCGENKLERFGLLVHDFGKALTPCEYHPKHHKHDKLGEIPIRAMCKRLHVPNKYKNFGILCSLNHMKAKRAYNMRPGKFVKWVLSLNLYFWMVMHVSFIDSAYREGADIDGERRYYDLIKERAESVFLAEETITGDMLLSKGVVPGKLFGERLLQDRIQEFIRLESL